VVDAKAAFSLTDTSNKLYEAAVGMYIYVYVYTYMYIYKYIHVYKYIYIHIDDIALKKDLEMQLTNLSTSVVRAQDAASSGMCISIYT
jgi:hypothetical protein